MTNLFFAGLKVLDLSTVLAGPSVATFFAELGADVVKIENPSVHGDVTRSWKLATEDGESSVSAYFSSVNYHKQYLRIDLLAQRDELDHWLQWGDVLVTNFKSSDYAKFRLEPQDVSAVNNRIIFARLKGFDSNPDRVAYDIVLQAETGFMFMNGTAESGPVKMPVALIDVLAAHQLKEGILCGLLQRERTGRGCTIDCSLEKTGLASLVNQASNYLMAGYIPRALGSLHPNIAPYGEIFKTSDGGSIVLAVGSDRQFRTLCRLLGKEAIADDERFASNQSRLKNREAMSAALQIHFSNQTQEQWMQLFVAHNVPAGAMRDMSQVMQQDVARQMILEEKIDGVDTKRLASVAFTIS